MDQTRSDLLVQHLDERIAELTAQVAHALTALRRASHLVPLVTVRQAVEAGDDALDAAGLNPYCMNEGLAEGDERIGSWWLEDAIGDLEGRE